MSDIKVGDELILVPAHGRRNRQNVTVSRIGRKYLYITPEGGQESRERFRIDTLVQDTQYGSPDRLYTQAQLDEQNLRIELLGKLSKLGVDLRLYGNRSRWTADRLRRLLEVVES